MQIIAADLVAQSSKLTAAMKAKHAKARAKAQKEYESSCAVATEVDVFLTGLGTDSGMQLSLPKQLDSLRVKLETRINNGSQMLSPDDGVVTETDHEHDTKALDVISQMQSLMDRLSTCTSLVVFIYPPNNA